MQKLVGLPEDACLLMCAAPTTEFKREQNCDGYAVQCPSWFSALARIIAHVRPEDTVDKDPVSTNDQVVLK